MTPAPIDYAEIARRVNARLAKQVKPGTMPEVVSLWRVTSTLTDAPGLWLHHAALIREVAEEVRKEQAK